MIDTDRQGMDIDTKKTHDIDRGDTCVTIRSKTMDINARPPFFRRINHQLGKAGLKLNKFVKS